MLITEFYDLYSEAKSKNIKFYEFHEFIGRKLERQQHDLDQQMVIDCDSDTEVQRLSPTHTNGERPTEPFSAKAF